MKLNVGDFKVEVSKLQAIRALEKRMDYLSYRIANSDRNLSFDKQELASLSWCIAEVLKIYPGIAEKLRETKYDK